MTQPLTPTPGSVEHSEARTEEMADAFHAELEKLTPEELFDMYDRIYQEFLLSKGDTSEMLTLQ